MKYRFGVSLPVLRKILAGTLLTAAVVVMFVAMKNPMGAKSQLYSVARDMMKMSLDIKTFNWYVVDGDGFRVKYQPVDAPVVRLVLETAENVYMPVNEMLDYIPEKPVPVFIYPTKETLNKSFGWDAAVNAMGVYWAGSIRILSPMEWIDKEKELAEVFQESGPMAHEYTHLVVDYKTNGNYPRWFTEGIAQYVERELTGFVLTDNESGTNTWYSFARMDEQFDLLPDQNLAYEQSLLAVDYLVELEGFPGVLRVLDELALGKDISEALTAVTGQDLAAFESSFTKWTFGLR